MADWQTAVCGTAGSLAVGVTLDSGVLAAESAEMKALGADKSWGMRVGLGSWSFPEIIWVHTEGSGVCCRKVYLSQ